ncbi:hypothetical protein HanXRQr2_Chr07g0305121 [Helianthus annuus]|uniref:Uncharacterized protein n=1 Tax=Helianthus annuus TaxID=4232 RepID=A0A9K3NH29_HELAN|nr:hypothetical protein HanXRQr2_Chr07g0305121 [Helianthus annuus]KAJ0905572.1 hypothetical protein HanPSC8_Chr07g0295491 [Helianthus annuus]
MPTLPPITHGCVSSVSFMLQMQSWTHRKKNHAVADVVARARETGYKAGYTECLTHVNVVSE